MANMDLKNLNPEQLRAVTRGDGPLLIVAGAGTGKTTVITARIAWLIEQGKAGQEEILALTFTDKAAEEMEERVARLLPFGYTDLWISTFHSFCERILKDNGLDIGLPSDFRLLDSTQAWLLIRQNLDKFDLRYYKPLGNPVKFIHALISHFSRCKDEGIYPEDYLKYSDDLKLNMDGIAVGSKAVKSSDKKDIAQFQQEADRIKEVAEAYAVFQKLLLDNNALDFGDLINYCLKLFKQRPLILDKYRKQFKYILVDEFQDTNWVQYELVKLLAEPKNNLTVAGDDDQSVFQWRGASFNNVLQFRKDFPSSKEVILVRNYRSCQNILDLSYKFIQLNNPNRLEYQLNQVKEISEKARKKGIDLEDFRKVNKKLIAVKSGQAIIKHLYGKTSEQEVDEVLNKIMELMNKDKEAMFKDFVILARTNEAANVFSRAMERAGIPHQFLASKGLYSKPIILDIISYFKLLDNYHESSALWRILNLPFLGIPSDEIAKISQYSYRKACSIYEALNQISLISGISARVSEKINRVLSLIQKHSALAREKNVSEILVAFLEDSGYLKYLVRKGNERTMQDLDLINQFYDKIKEFENSQIDPSLNNFKQQMEMELESGEEGGLRFNVEAGPDMVKIMTIHSAKGLEFKYVFLVNLVDKRFPCVERKEPIEIPESLIKEVLPKGNIHLQEERRLFYVGMTRAKNGLFFSSARDYGETRNKKPSRFLIELGLVPAASLAEIAVQKESKKTRFPYSPKRVKIKDKTGYSLPNHFSFTQLAAFEKCPLQYKFAHILKIPVQGKATFSFGKTMHKTLFQWVSLKARERNVVQKSLLSDATKLPKEPRFNFKELLEIYKKNWIDEWYENQKQKKDYYRLGRKELKIFYDNFVRTNPCIAVIDQQLGLEQKFNLRIGNYTLIGQIDRIDKLANGTVEIIDYKTGKVKTKLKPEDKDQLLIYQIAAEEVLGVKPSKLSYYYLEDNSAISFLGTDREKKDCKEKIIKNIKRIQNSDFSPSPGWQCKFCDFKDICEYKKN